MEPPLQMLVDGSVTRLRILSDEYLWTSLERIMNKNELWRNPDLTISFLAKTVGSNRTTLSRLIHQHGYSCFQTYVSDYRIDAFLEQLPQNRLLNIQGLFYEVGFKSKVTALRHFRRRTGMTPSEYYKKVIMKLF